VHVPLSFRRRGVAALAAAALAAPLMLVSSTSATASPDPAKKGEQLARKLVKRAEADDAQWHLRVFQSLADISDGNRAAGSQGHDLSAWYVGTLLRGAGYDVSYQEFEFTYVETLAEELRVVSPDAREVPVRLMTYTTSTPEGGIQAPVEVVPEDETTGCEASDFAGGDYTGKIALVRRGACSFAQKQQNAADAGAVGAVIYNNTEGELNGTLGGPDAARIPTGGVSQADGEALAAAAAEGEVVVNLEVRELQEERTTANVLAETRGGDADNTVMLGAHLDGVSEGPGINDNGSGSAGLLEAALELAHADRHGRHENKVRFAFWSAEELGLIGSEHYVTELSEAQREDIALYLNFDMIASPNHGLFVYDGDDSDGVGAGPGPAGSAEIEAGINGFMDSRGYQPRGTDFTGRSDYGPFIEVGIPSGGTFTGAEGIKTPEQAELWGGEAGVAYDPCYHAACDDLDNISMAAFDANVKVIADAVGRYAWDTSAVDAAVAQGAAKSSKSLKAGKAERGAEGEHSHGGAHAGCGEVTE
jgi:Zn-dependent M28 family amino/carboxypeptidase